MPRTGPVTHAVVRQGPLPPGRRPARRTFAVTPLGGAAVMVIDAVTA
ncbi:hypothetical protein [Streptomyces albogriseolus]